MNHGCPGNPWRTSNSRPGSPGPTCSSRRLSLDPGIEREAYLVRTETGRPDLVAKDYYGDTRYESYVILQAGGIGEIRAGNVIWLATPASLKRIL